MLRAVSIGIIGTLWHFETVFLFINFPNLILCRSVWNINEEDAVKAFRPCKRRWKFRYVIHAFDFRFECLGGSKDGRFQIKSAASGVHGFQVSDFNLNGDERSLLCFMLLLQQKLFSSQESNRKF